MKSPRKKEVLMVAYATYSNDARIKSYVATLDSYGYSYEIWMLKENGYEDPHLKQIMKKYQGKSKLRYAFGYVLFFLIVFFKISLRPREFATIHFNNIPNFIVFAFFIPKLFGARVVLDMHDTMPTIYLTKYHSNSLVYELLRFEEKSGAKFADHVITAVHKQAEDLYNYGILSNKVTTILNLPNPSLVRNFELDHHHEGVNLVMHGTITSRLGLDLALYAMKEARTQISNTRLHLIGDGDYTLDLVKLAERLNLNDTVYFSKRFLPFEELLERLKSMDIGILPYRKNIYSDEYQLPVKLLEYVYLGIPVIAPCFKSIKRYFNENSLCYFEPENVNDMVRKIITLVKDVPLRRQLVENSRKALEAYDWKIQEGTYLKILERQR